MKRSPLRTTPPSAKKKKEALKQLLSNQNQTLNLQ